MKIIINYNKITEKNMKDVIKIEEVKKCPKCGFHGSMTSIGSISTTKRKCICPKCHNQFVD